MSKTYVTLEFDSEMHSTFVWVHQGNALCMSSIDKPEAFTSAIPLETLECSIMGEKQVIERVRSLYFASPLETLPKSEPANAEDGTA